MKKLNILALCALYLLVQSCSKKENSIILNSSKLNSKKAIQWTLGSPLVNGVYSFQNPNGNTFWVISQTAGSLVQAYTNAIGWPTQEWEVTCLGDVYGVPIYTIINHYSGLAMAVVGSSKSQNAQIDQETYTQAANQIWGITSIGSGQYEIWNANSGFALVIPGDVTTQGTDLVQETYSIPNVFAQDWQPALITQSDSVTVNFGSTTGTMNHVASGFLHGFYDPSGTMQPPSSVANPLKINTVRDWYFGNAEDNYRLAAMVGQGYKDEIVISDGWTIPHKPAPQTNWANWDSYVTTTVNNARAAVGSSKYSSLEYDIFNEPDFYFGNPNLTTEFYPTWQHAYNDIKNIDPSAVIVGPSLGLNIAGVEAFLSWCKTNNCLPNYVSWHFSDNIGADVNTVQTYMTQNGITGTSGFQQNEYLHYYDQYAAKNAWFIAQIDRAKLNAAMHAIWGAQAGQLDGIDSTAAGNYVKHASWFVYKAYGDITGSTLTTTPGTKVDVVAGHAASPNSVTMLVGTQGGLAAGTVQVKCTNVSSIFSGRTTVTVNLQLIPNSNDGYITSTTHVYTENVPVVNNTAYIYIPYGDYHDAYEITVQ